MRILSVLPAAGRTSAAKAAASAGETSPAKAAASAKSSAETGNNQYPAAA